MAVITKNDFLARYDDGMAKASAKDTQLNALVGTVSPRSVLPLIEAQVNAVNTLLKQLRDDPNYTVGAAPGRFVALRTASGDRYHLFKSWLTKRARYRLLGYFASLLGPFVVKWVFKTGSQLLPPDYRVTNTVINAFQNLAGNIRVRQIVDRRTQLFQDNMRLLCDRLYADWDDINALFFPGEVLKKLIAVDQTGSDFHKGGKQVQILTFKVHPPARIQRLDIGFATLARVKVPARRVAKLVYKPSDLELDYRIVGDSEALQGALPNLIVNQSIANEPSLFCALNAELAANVPAGGQLQLPVYKILPRNRGSRLAPVGGRLQIEQCYGYIEFLTYAPPCTNNNPLTVALDEAAPHLWDYVVDDPTGNVVAQGQLRRFYRTFGWYMAIGLVLSFGDQHTENLFVHRRQPCLIDLEICFKHRANDLAATMLNDHFANLDPHENKNVLLILRNDGVLEVSAGSQAAVHVVAGFNEAIAWIRAQHQVIQDWLNGADMANLIVRYTPRPTATFTNNMREVYSVDHVDQVIPDPNLPGTFAGVEPFTSFHNKDLYPWYQAGGRGYKGRPLYAVSVPQHDFTCYLNGDAPEYFRRFGSLDLLDARGRAVACGAPAPAALGMWFPPHESAILFVPSLAAPTAEWLQLRATATNTPIGTFELVVNPGNAANQPLAVAVNGAVPNLQIVVTCGTDNGGANAPPTLTQLHVALGNVAQVTNVLHVELMPIGAAGNTVVQPQAALPIWARFPNTPAPGAATFFSVDAEGVYPALAAQQIALGRLAALANNTEAALVQENNDSAGMPLPAPLHLDAVIQDFQNQPPLLLPNPTTVNF